MSQVNRNSAYLFEVDGFTVWEKLKNIRDFLGDRERALAISKIALEESDAEMSEGLMSRFDKRRAEVLRPHTVDIIDDCEREVSFLRELESRLAVEADKTRIKGKSDKDMYEINHFEEYTQKLLHRAQAETLANGRVSTDTMKYLLRDGYSLQRCIDSGIVVGISKPSDIPRIADSCVGIEIGGLKTIGLLPNRDFLEECLDEPICIN